MSVNINGVGCSLIDYLYTGIDFGAPSLQKYFSLNSGDGGITPGKLVFTEEFEIFSGTPFLDAVEEITGGKSPDGMNLGGPAIVALVNTAQLLSGRDININFYGAMGHDDTGDSIRTILSGTAVNIDHYKQVEGISPSTIVLSDPGYDGGNGERAFINNIGAAWNLTPDLLGEDFFKADIVLFGATGLTPVIHDNLTDLLLKGKKEGCVTIVTTVFDFRNEKKNPDKRWPLGRSDESYRNIDLLITDREEALRLTGETDVTSALTNFTDMGTGAVVITSGADDICYASTKALFSQASPSTLPISKRVSHELKSGERAAGDTTGCGDNFAGGVLASVAEQLDSGRTELSLEEACAWGVVSGGYACFYIGGTYHEKTPGEKRQDLTPYFDAYLKQLSEIEEDK